MRTWISSVLAVCVVCSSGCTGFGTDAEREEQLENLEACQGGASKEEALDTILISEEYGDSLHEMIACGNLTLLFCGAVVGAVIETIQAGAEGQTPDGWSYQDGVYHTENSGVTMDLQLVLAEDLAYGPVGTPITENLFLGSNYFVGATVSVDSDTQTATIEYDSTGPLVELLGFGAEPANPLVVSTADLEAAAGALGKLAFTTQLHLDDEVETSIIRYHLQSVAMTATELLDQGQIQFQLVEADGERADLEQTLTVTDWALDFVEYAVMDGYTAFQVNGRSFDYQGRLVFDNSAWPERELECQ